MKNKLKILSFILIIIVNIPFVYCYAENRSNNPLLKQIIIDEKNLDEFEQFTTEYVIATEKEEINIEVQPDDKNATVEIIGNQRLQLGKNEIEIKVTAEDKKTIQSYYLHITRGDTAKSNANLKTLEVENIELSPHFNVNEINYYFQYQGDIKNIKINAIPESDEATVDISKTNNEENIIFNIVVIAEDKITKKTYTITATKSEDDKNIDEKQELNEYEREENIELTDNNSEVSQGNSRKKFFMYSIIAVITIFLIIAIKIIKRKKYKT